MRLICHLAPDHEWGEPGLAVGVTPHDGPRIVSSGQLGRAPHYADVSAVTESLLRSTSQALRMKTKTILTISS